MLGGATNLFIAGSSRKVGTRGGGWVHPKGVNSMAASGLGCRKALVGTGWAISLLCMNGLRKQTSGLVGASISDTQAWSLESSA